MKLENIFQNLHDDDIKIRASAIITMGKTGERGAIGPLIEILGNPKEVDWLRGCAAIALGRLSGDEVILPLIDAMQDDIVDLTKRLVSEPSTLGNEASVLALMEGSLELTLDHKIKHLKVGESIHYNSEIPHKLKNLGNDTTRCLVMLYTP